MKYLPRLSGVLLALLWFSGCGTTVTLKSGSQPPRAAKAEPAENGSGAGVSSRQGGAEASVRSSEESPEGKVASNTGAARAKAVITFRDRFTSGLRTGTVGAAFGGLGGPVGFAAGGGTGFLAGFVVGRPLLGGGAPLADNQSWERQVENQKTWEEQVASHVEQLDGQPPASSGANASTA